VARGFRRARIGFAALLSAAAQPPQAGEGPDTEREDRDPGLALTPSSTDCTQRRATPC